jgi:hypothetical protein
MRECCLVSRPELCRRRVGRGPIDIHSLAHLTIPRILHTTTAFRRPRQSVDLMGSDPLLTVVEAKNGNSFPSTAVMKGSDPIKSTDSSRRRTPLGGRAKLLLSRFGLSSLPGSATRFTPVDHGFCTTQIRITFPLDGHLDPLSPGEPIPPRFRHNVASLSQPRPTAWVSSPITCIAPTGRFPGRWPGLP